MDIASMLEREDFYGILQRTLIDYYRRVCGREIQVEYTPFDGCETLCIYSRLSFISRRNVPTGAREFLYSEYNVRGNLLKYIAGKLLVFLATHAHGMGAIRKLYITKDMLGKNAFISPQNRSIRIFDYDSMTVDCIVKDGFTRKYFDNQLVFRKNFPYEFVPPLIDSGEGWFRERIMRGHPLARVTDEAAYCTAQKTAMEYMARLARETQTVVRAGEYVQELATDIRNKLKLAETQKHIRSTAALQKTVDRLAVDVRDMEVPLVTGHGDLQSGNIWLENDGRVWIYDWETAGRRSIWYDSATLLYSTRRATGLEQMMASDEPEKLCFSDTRRDYSAAEIQQIKRIVLLEDILFYLEDMLELPGEDGVLIFERFAQRIVKLTEGMENDCWNKPV